MLEGRQSLRVHSLQNEHALRDPLETRLRFGARFVSRSKDVLPKRSDISHVDGAVGPVVSHPSR